MFKEIKVAISHHQSRCGWFDCVRVCGGNPKQKKKEKQFENQYHSFIHLNCFPFLNYCLIFWITTNGDFSTKICELSYSHHIFLVLRRPTACPGHSKYKNLPSHYNLWLTGGFFSQQYLFEAWLPKPTDFNRLSCSVSTKKSSCQKLLSLCCCSCPSFQ